MKTIPGFTAESALSERGAHFAGRAFAEDARRGGVVLQVRDDPTPHPWQRVYDPHPNPWLRTSDPNPHPWLGRSNGTTCVTTRFGTFCV
jgi:hypothetical protein